MGVLIAAKHLYQGKSNAFTAAAREMAEAREASGGSDEQRALLEPQLALQTWEEVVQAWTDISASQDDTHPLYRQAVLSAARQEFDVLAMEAKRNGASPDSSTAPGATQSAVLGRCVMAMLMPLAAQARCNVPFDSPERDDDGDTDEAESDEGEVWRGGHASVRGGDPLQTAYQELVAALDASGGAQLSLGSMRSNRSFAAGADPSIQFTDYVAKGYCPRLDELRELRDESHQAVLRLQNLLRQKVGIDTIKVKKTAEQGYVAVALIIFARHSTHSRGLYCMTHTRLVSAACRVNHTN